MIARPSRVAICAAATLACVLIAGSCTQGPPKDAPVAQAKKAQQTEPGTGPADVPAVTCREHVVPWGSASGQVGWVPKGNENKARGPMAVAMGNAGHVFILDNVNRRLVRLDENGTVRVVTAGLEKFSSDLALGSDGSLAVLNLWKATVSVFDHKGHPAGTLSVPRVFRHVNSISVGVSRQVTLRNAYQETFLLGSPGAPLPLASVLRTKTEGAIMLDHELGLSVRLTGNGHAELMALDNGPARKTGGRHQVQFRRTVQGPISALRLVGVAGQAACMKLERVSGGTSVSVHRSARCIDIATGAVVYDMDLPAPGDYLPRRELAAGGSSPALSFIHPSAAGLKVKVCTVPQRGASARNAGRRAAP